MMAEVPTPIVTEETGLATTRGDSLLERWVEGTPERALQKLETLSRVLEQMRGHAMKQTYPSDWVIHTTVDKASGEITKQVGYLQDSGAERAGKIFGIEVGRVTEHREDFQDGTFAYHMSAAAWSKLTGEHIPEAIGSRWSGDTFFMRGLDEGERVNPMDVRKAAYANLHGRAARSLTGLSAVPLEVLGHAGVDIKKCMFVAYNAGAKGGESAGASLGGAEVTMPFGNGQGKKPSELEDKDLDWYTTALTKSVGDASKSKFKKANERILAGLTAEKERRAQKAAHSEATGTPAATKASAAQDEESTPIGGKRANLWALAQEIDAKRAMPLLKRVAREMLGKEIAGLSDLADEAELDTLLKVPKATYTQTLKLMVDEQGKQGGAKK
jgi:hypothetical protein